MMGYKNGVIKILCSLVSFLLALVFSGVISPYVVEKVCENKEIYNSVYEKVNETVEIEVDREELSLDNEQIIENLRIPQFIKDKIEFDENTEIKNLEEVKNIVYSTITDVVIRIVVYVAVTILTFVILVLIALILGIIEKFPIASELNKLVGAAAGAAVGVVIIYVMMIFVMLTEHTKISSNIIKNIADNEWLNYMYTNNYLWDFIMNFIEMIKKIKL
jgi:uncharacterized membrane protein required for colicin V production